MAKKKSKKTGKKEAKASSGNESVLDGKAIAAVSYITWLGLIIAVLLNMDKKNEFAKYHIRQSLLLLLLSLLGFIPVLGWILFLVIVVLLIMGFFYALNGQKKEVPIVGALAQDWFKSI